MMRKMLLVVATLVLLFGLASDSSALSLTGWVVPTWTSNTTGTATYTFTFVDGGFEVTAFRVRFLETAFASVSGFTILSNPAGGALSLNAPGFFDPWDVTYSGTFGSTALTSGQSVSFSVDFVLKVDRTDPVNFDPFNPANPWGLTNTLFEQGYSYTLTNSSGVSGTLGESTGLAPEPGTLLLLGSGLVGIGAAGRFSRRRRKKK